MRAIGREDLIPEVARVNGGIALLNVAGSSWLILPDGHMLLWRYYSATFPRSRAANGILLNWPISEFPTKPCSDNAKLFGCVGREISPAGSLLQLK
jgi:hypothetical protein